MKNLILISDGKYFEFDSIEGLREFIIPHYKELSKEEITNYLYEKAFGFSMINDLSIVETSKGTFGGNYEIEKETFELNNAIIIDNVDTYILSLCKYNAITLLEEHNNRNYTKNIQADIGKDNYIVVNAYANDLLMAMVGDEK